MTQLTLSSGTQAAINAAIVASQTATSAPGNNNQLNATAMVDIYNDIKNSGMNSGTVAWFSQAGLSISGNSLAVMLGSGEGGLTLNTSLSTVGDTSRFTSGSITLASGDQSDTLGLSGVTIAGAGTVGSTGSIVVTDPLSIRRQPRKRYHHRLHQHHGQPHHQTTRQQPKRLLLADAGA